MNYLDYDHNCDNNVFLIDNVFVLMHIVCIGMYQVNACLQTVLIHLFCAGGGCRSRTMHMYYSLNSLEHVI